MQETDTVFSVKSFEDHLVDILSEDEGKVPLSKVMAGLKSAGLCSNDPRLKECMDKIKKLRDIPIDGNTLDGRDMFLDQEEFKDCIKDNIVLIRRAFTADFVIPEFKSFCDVIQGIYDKCKDNKGGKPASYIPQLARYNPDLWGVTICSVDGQRHSIGDTKKPFSIQSCSKPLNYALALSELGPDYVHKYVGQEPSGESFNHIKLGHGNKPP